MSEPVELLLGVRVDRDEFADMVVDLGGVRGPGPVNTATLFREQPTERAVWVFVDTGEEPEPEQVILAEERLGGPVRTRVILDYSTGMEGSDWLAMEIIEAAATRWPLLIDTLEGGLPASETLFTTDELRARVAGRRYVFSEEVPADASLDDILESNEDSADAWTWRAGDDPDPESA